MRRCPQISLSDRLGVQHPPSPSGKSVLEHMDFANVAGSIPSEDIYIHCLRCVSLSSKKKIQDTNGIISVAKNCKLN